MSRAYENDEENCGSVGAVVDKTKEKLITCLLIIGGGVFAMIVFIEMITRGYGFQVGKYCWLGVDLNHGRVLAAPEICGWAVSVSIMQMVFGIMWLITIYIPICIPALRDTGSNVVVCMCCHRYGNIYAILTSAMLALFWVTTALSQASGFDTMCVNLEKYNKYDPDQGCDQWGPYGVLQSCIFFSWVCGAIMAGLFVWSIIEMIRNKSQASEAEGGYTQVGSAGGDYAPPRTSDADL